MYKNQYGELFTIEQLQKEAQKVNGSFNIGASEHIPTIRYTDTEGTQRVDRFLKVS